MPCSQTSESSYQHCHHTNMKPWVSDVVLCERFFLYKRSLYWLFPVCSSSPLQKSLGSHINTWIGLWYLYSAFNSFSSLNTVVIILRQDSSITMAAVSPPSRCAGENRVVEDFRCFFLLCCQTNILYIVIWQGLQVVHQTILFVLFTAVFNLFKDYSLIFHRHWFVALPQVRLKSLLIHACSAFLQPPLWPADMYVSAWWWEKGV